MRPDSLGCIQICHSESQIRLGVETSGKLTSPGLRILVLDILSPQ